MKTFKRVLCLMLALLIIGSFCACGNESSGNPSYSSGNSSYSDSVYIPKIETSSAAIRAVKNYMPGSFLSVEQQIAAKLGFKKFYSPDYGTETAKQNDDGSWEVTLKGKMSGYIDEYHDDFESYKFEVTAKVSVYGTVSNIRVMKVY